MMDAAERKRLLRDVEAAAHRLESAARDAEMAADDLQACVDYPTEVENAQLKRACEGLRQAHADVRSLLMRGDLTMRVRMIVSALERRLYTAQREVEEAGHG